MKPTKEQEDICKAYTLEHIREVNRNLLRLCGFLMMRADQHDESKLHSPELEIFSTAPSLDGVEYGTPEYEVGLVALAPAIKHHYSKNRHHPEHWPNGINDMNIVDLVEMICDWKAATKRNKNGNILKSIEKNADKFGISPQLKKILENSVRDLFP